MGGGGMGEGEGGREGDEAVVVVVDYVVHSPPFANLLFSRNILCARKAFLTVFQTQVL